MDSLCWLFSYQNDSQEYLLPTAVATTYPSRQFSVQWFCPRFPIDCDRERTRPKNKPKKCRAKDSFNCCFFTRNVLFSWWLCDNMHIYNSRHHVIKVATDCLFAIHLCHCAPNSPFTLCYIYRSTRSLAKCKWDSHRSHRSDYFTFWRLTISYGVCNSFPLHVRQK